MTEHTDFIVQASVIKYNILLSSKIDTGRCNWGREYIITIRCTWSFWYLAQSYTWISLWRACEILVKLFFKFINLQSVHFRLNAGSSMCPWPSVSIVWIPYKISRAFSHHFTALYQNLPIIAIFRVRVHSIYTCTCYIMLIQ